MFSDPSQNRNPPQPPKVSPHVSSQEVLLSEHKDIDVRGKVNIDMLECHTNEVAPSTRTCTFIINLFCSQFQQERIGRFCRHNFITREREYPEGSALDAFYRHLMFDDAHKVIFCFIPKVCYTTQV